jgi:hypothetical protein
MWCGVKSLHPVARNCFEELQGPPPRPTVLTCSDGEDVIDNVALHAVAQCCLGEIQGLLPRPAMLTCAAAGIVSGYLMTRVTPCSSTSILRRYRFIFVSSWKGQGKYLGLEASRCLGKPREGSLLITDYGYSIGECQT